MWNYYYFGISIVNRIFVVGLQDNPYNVTCGYDFTDSSSVYEGEGQIEHYPWLGILLYPMGRTRVTSVVVLVTRQMAIGSASEIDKLPKHRFRAIARVVLGTNCDGPSIGIREYTYHPEFAVNTFSTLAMLQLDMDHVTFEVHPICGPPTHFIDMSFYALTLNEDCEYPVVTIHKMEYVDERKCQRFYRTSGLDEGSMWPTHLACARAVSGRECVWRGGAALVTKLGDRWHLLGFGFFGPGCHAPARFLDYGVYVPWVKRAVARIGKPAVTRLNPGHIILRRTISSLQRFGRCDKEEVKKELYTDKVSIEETDKKHKLRRVRYNITLYDDVEYSCVIFKVFHNTERPAPLLRLRRWCSESTSLCSGFQFIQIDFYIEIEFIAPITFKMAAYGRRPSVIDPRKAMWYYNKQFYKGYYGPDEYKFKVHLNKSRHLYWTQEKARPRPLNYKEWDYYKRYVKNMNAAYNKKQNIFKKEKSDNLLYWKVREEYYEYVYLHSLYNPDSLKNNTHFDLNEPQTKRAYTRYKQLENIFGQD